MTDRIDWEAHGGEVVDVLGDWTVTECEPCGFRHVIPLPSEDELARLYGGRFYETDEPDYLERLETERPWWDALYAERLDRLERLREVASAVPAAARSVARGSGSASGSPSLLDVGCGYGFMLDQARARGWLAVGIEPSRRAGRHARERGHEVVEGLLRSEMVPGLGAYDVVHASGVLEHVRDPRAFLSLCWRLTAPGGLVCIAAPNDYSPLQRAALLATRVPLWDGFPWWVAPPHHLNYFDFNSLEMLLRAAGLEPVGRTAEFPLELFMLMGLEYVGDSALGRKCHGMRVMFEQRMRAAGFDGLRREMYDGFARLGIGRRAVIFALRAES